MIDGININSPKLSGANESGGAVARSANAQEAQVRTTKDVLGSRASAAVTTSAEKRYTALSSANVLDFLQAAENFIDAALPNKPPGTKLRINLDDDSGRFVYQGIDVKTGDVVTQFPADDVLKYLAFIREKEGIEGIVVDEEA
ncbi:MAG: flagellar protein FlaG [Emcibacter sp.]|nr:flagellar protein FlaG [Emcibacter sp.]